MKELLTSRFAVGLFYGALLGVFVLGGTSVLMGNESLLERDNTLAAVLPGTLLALTNADRASNGATTLTENALLDQAAKLKAQDMAAKSYFAHVTPDGKTPLHFLDQVGYHYQNVGENLGLNYDDSAAVETAWMNSPEHRENLLFPQFTEIGIGTAEGMYQGAPATFAVEIFATPFPAPVTSSANVHPVSASANTTSLPAATSPAHASSTPKPTPSATVSANKAARILQLRAVITALQLELSRLTAELNSLQSAK